MVNDPGTWGSTNPKVLVLGISKGFTQAKAYDQHDFDAVPFMGCRDRLKAVLQSIELMDADDSIDAHISDSEENFAWGSVVRCSLSGWNSKQNKYRSGTPEVLPAFLHTEASRFISGCMQKFLGKTPENTKIIVLLGNDNRYIKIMRSRLSGLFLHDYALLNAVSHRADGKVWIHVAHPSPQNGHFGQFVEGPTSHGQGLKRNLAIEAVRSVIDHGPSVA